MKINFHLLISSLKKNSLKNISNLAPQKMKAMIKIALHSLSPFFFVLISISLQAQSLNLYGLWFDRNESAVDTTIVYDPYYGINDTIFEQDFSAGNQNFVALNTATGLIETVSILDSVKAINFNSSTLNQRDRTYSFLGRNSANEDRIFTVEVASGSYVDYPVLVNLPRELNFDLRNGVNYGFETVDTETGYDENEQPIIDRQLFLSTFDAVTGSNTVIGQVDSVLGIVVDGSAVNSNEGLFYFIGKDVMQNTWLYTLLLEDASIVNQAAIPDNVNYLGLVYDNVNEKLLAIHQNERNLVEIDPVTAMHDLIAEFNFPNGTVDVFLGGTPLFDQATSTYIFVGRYENSADLRLVTINSISGGLINDSVLDKTVIELQVDNSNFARRFYSDPNECAQSPAVGLFNCE